ncbi:MAG: hypothetical protein ABL977_09545 [Candidatus Eisenbacteria bacterium]
MNAHDDLRGSEYTALMQQVRELGRTSQWCWTASAIAAAFLLSNAITAHHPGLMLPVELCAAFGFYATLDARRRTKRIESFVREFHEHEATGAQWFTRIGQPATLPGFQSRTEWVPLAIANVIVVVAVVYSWVFADGAAHGELMAALATMGAMAFAVHSLVENMQFEQQGVASPAASTGWTNSAPGLREVPAPKRAASDR